MAIPIAAAALGSSVFDLLSGPSVVDGLPSLSGGDAGPSTAFSSATQNVNQGTGDFSPNFGGSAGQIATASIVPVVIAAGVIVLALAMFRGGK